MASVRPRSLDQPLVPGVFLFHHTTKTEVQTEIQQSGPDFKSIPCCHPPAFEMLFQIPHALFSESPSIHPPYNMDSVDTQV